MTKLDALKELAAKVEAGTLPEAVFHGSSSIRGHWAYITGLTNDQRTKVFLAYNGSLDAAKALHEAVLPGYTWAISGALSGLESAASVALSGSYFGVSSSHNPARAWLLAIILALIAQEESA